MTWMGNEKLGYFGVFGLAATVVITGCVGSETIMQIQADNIGTDSESVGFSSDEEPAATADSESEEWDFWGDSTDCGSGVWQTDNFVIDDPHLLNAMSGVTHFRGDLKISAIRADVEAMAPLQSLRCVDGDFVIEYVDGLTDLSALNSLHTVGGALSIVDIHSLTDVSGLSNLHYIGGSLFINDNERLTNLDGIQNLWGLGGSSFLVSQNSALPTCLATNLFHDLSEQGWYGTICIEENSPDECESNSQDCYITYRRMP